MLVFGLFVPSITEKQDSEIANHYSQLVNFSQFGQFYVFRGSDVRRMEWSSVGCDLLLEAGRVSPVKTCLGVGNSTSP